MTRDISEKEWVDRFGRHRAIQGADKGGVIHMKIITEHPNLGWLGLEAARQEVEQSIRTADSK